MIGSERHDESPLVHIGLMNTVAHVGVVAMVAHIAMSTGLRCKARTSGKWSASDETIWLASVSSPRARVRSSDRRHVLVPGVDQVTGMPSRRAVANIAADRTGTTMTIWSCKWLRPYLYPASCFTPVCLLINDAADIRPAGQPRVPMRREISLQAIQNVSRAKLSATAVP